MCNEKALSKIGIEFYDSEKQHFELPEREVYHAHPLKQLLGPLLLFLLSYLLPVTTVLSWPQVFPFCPVVPHLRIFQMSRGQGRCWGGSGREQYRDRGTEVFCLLEALNQPKQVKSSLGRRFRNRVTWPAPSAPPMWAAVVVRTAVAVVPESTGEHRHRRSLIYVFSSAHPASVNSLVLLRAMILTALWRWEERGVLGIWLMNKVYPGFSY